MNSTPLSASGRPVRVRFAPSPTGPLHIGGVRTALYNYLFARQQGGQLILRIEDTDSARFVPGAEDYIREALDWLGIHFDEGVGIGGPFAPYRQSERKGIYRQWVDRLIGSGKAYLAFDTPQELEAARGQRANFQYDATTRLSLRNSLTLPPAEVDRLLREGAQYVVRMRVEPGREVLVDDIIRGPVRINSSVLDDKVLFKSADQLPTYHLANIVDDHLMQITHVIRGEEWLPSAPLHVLLYEALGWQDTMPRFAHLPLLLKPVGNGKLSKRDGDKLGFPVFPLQWRDPSTGALSSGYREQGYLPQAVVNFLALLGWNPGGSEEVLSMQDLIRQFDLTKCSKSGARFDYIKCQWFNHQHLLRLPASEWVPAFDRLLKEHGIESTPEREAAVVDLMKTKVVEYTDREGTRRKRNVSFVADLWPLTAFFFQPPTYDPNDKFTRKNWLPSTPAQMRGLAQLLEGVEPFTAEHMQPLVDAWAAAGGQRPWNAWRVCLVGTGQGPDMYALAQLLGKQETLKRMRSALEALS